MWNPHCGLLVLVLASVRFRDLREKKTVCVNIIAIAISFSPVLIRKKKLFSKNV